MWQLVKFSIPIRQAIFSFKLTFSYFSYFGFLFGLFFSFNDLKKFQNMKIFMLQGEAQRRTASSNNNLNVGISLGVTENGV